MLCINISGIKWRIEVIIWISKAQNGEGHGNPLQYSCLENPMDRGALEGYSPWGRKQSDTTEQLTHTHTQMFAKLKKSVEDVYSYEKKIHPNCNNYRL